MADTDKNTPLPKLRMRSGEMDGLFALFATLQEIEGVKSDMRERLKIVPNGYRDIRLVEVTLTKLLTELVKTVPDEKLRSIRKQLPRMKYKVYFNGTVSQMQDNATAIDARDLARLCEIAHDWRCFLCDDNCDHCKHGIAKIFDRVLKTDRGKGQSYSTIDFSTTDEE